MLSIMDKITVELSPMPQSSNFLQSPFWLDFKKRFGWQGFSFEVRYQDHIIPLIIMSRSIKSLISLAYCPHPAFHNIPNEDLPLFLKNLSRKLKRFFPKSIFIRWDLAINNDPQLKEALTSLLIPSSLSIQPPDTVILNLDISLETLLANMHKKTRYNIQLAERKGVTVIRAGVDELPKWYRMYEATARRDGITIHSLQYYQVLFDQSHMSHQHPQARLYLAYHEGDLLAGIISLFYNDTATYLYGASANIKRNFMASYALQWRSIQDAKNIGCLHYDLFGIPPTDDISHPMHGLYQFKTGFGGIIYHRLGAWDYPLNPFLFPFYQWAEKRRQLKLIKRKAKKKSMLTPYSPS
jgi:lipid II:glycine glycyltransferase (peptidoglycan interpeptide bridge formation enzyme)